MSDKEYTPLDEFLCAVENFYPGFWDKNGGEKAYKELAALTYLLEMVRECRHLGDHMLRKQINTALELFDEATKGQ
jgi:hypothetical protein